MMDCSHKPDDIQCITLYLVVFQAAVLTICVIYVARICCIVTQLSKKHRHNLQCDRNPLYLEKDAKTQHELQCSTNEGVDLEDISATSAVQEETKTCDKHRASSNKGENNDIAEASSNKGENNDIAKGTYIHNADNRVEETGKAKINRKPVFVLLKDDRLEEFLDNLLKDLGLTPQYYSSVNAPKVDKQGHFMFEDETSTIIEARFGVTRIDSDIQGSCKNMADSDIKRTILLIINEFKNNKKDKHGEIIKQNIYDIDYINNLKCIAVLNYKCYMEDKKCDRCKYALHEFRQHVISPNYKEHDK